MKIGSADVYANHPVIVIGSSACVDDQLALDGTAAVASDAHVMVATRGQAALVRVSVWKEVGPRTGQIVFDGGIVLADRAVAVFDVEGLSRFTATIGASGHHHVTISVDGPGVASRIDVIFEAGSETRALTAAHGYPLFDVSVPLSSGLGVSDELALILSGHDSPMNRLAAAIKLIGESSAPRPAIRSFWVRMIVEWIRWLSPQQSHAESRLLGAMIEERLTGDAAHEMDALAVELASELLRRTA
ncbi:hypothetical protein AB0M47_04785 [Hamadaea sp. NPDC051192]|uniref:hypothetical protein n=1 Tax=Hamadaea sp. NPDC051192 TaxID=3154940 RepID=UPI0034485D49